MKPFSKGLFLASLACGLVMSSCGNEAPWDGTSGEGGKISLNLTTDGSVFRSTRADDNMSPVVPGAEEFRISLNSSDGSYSKEWSTLAAFNKEEGFPMGNYKIVAEYGDLETEGFTAPYYKGDADVSVRLGEESSAEIKASLANSMVSIRYTDEFTQAFPAYSASIQSKGHEPIVFAQNETRPAYVTPSEVALAVTMSKDMTQTVTVNPASFTTTARRHYIVTIGVEGNVAQGTGVLKVTFEENVEQEVIDIALSDELFNAPEPYVTPNDDAKSDIEHFELVTFDGNPEFHVFAYGGIKSAKLTVTAADGGKVPAFGSEVELVNADATAQAQLKAAGVDCAGFFTQAGEMGVVNFKEFIKNLAPGSYKVALNVTDNLVRSIAAEDLSVLNAKISAVEYEVSAGTAPKFMGETMEVVVATNCEALKDEMSFTVDGKAVNVSGTPVRVQAPVQTRADLSYQYKYTLGVDPIADSEVTVSGAFANKPAQNVKVAVDMPQYTMDTDAFAKKVKIRVNYADAAMRKIIVEKAKVYAGNSTVSAGNITRDVENGIIEVKGLNSATAYNTYSLTLGTNKERNNTVVPAFTTEEAAGVPNGDFEDLVETINTTIQQGSKWTITVAGAQRKTDLSMQIKEPVNWKSTNEITCNLNSSTLNSWYTIPSVYNTTLSWLAHQPKVQVAIVYQEAHTTTPSIYENLSSYSQSNAMVIRNVAWDSNGSDVGVTKQTVTSSNYYGHEVPEIANRTAGRMYLGTTAGEGVSFATRPTALKGYYKYVRDYNDQQEKGVVTVEVLAGSEVISSGQIELGPQDNYTEFTIPLTCNYAFNKKATSLKISISSSNKTSGIETTNYCNKDECCSRGAMLTVDALSFEY
jgi:hypothetical protein